MSATTASLFSLRAETMTISGAKPRRRTVNVYSASELRKILSVGLSFQLGGGERRPNSRTVAVVRTDAWAEDESSSSSGEAREVI